MNEKTREKFLRLRQRADGLELDLIAARAETSAALGKVVAAEGRLNADAAARTHEAQQARQLATKRETMIARLIEVLNELAPHVEANTGRELPGRWREVVENEFLWADLARQFREADALLDATTSGTSVEFSTRSTRPTFRVAPDGQSVTFVGGGGASSFGGSAHGTAGGSGGVIGWPIVGRPLRTDDERRSQ